MSDTTHLQLPLLAAAQAQKHVTHNDALLRLDAIVQLSVKDRDLTAPPASPSDGDRYIPAAGSTGDWSSWDLNVAWYSDGVWTKLVPRVGWRAWIEDEDTWLVWTGAEWVSQEAGDIAFTPAGNIASSDVQAAVEELDQKRNHLGAHTVATLPSASPAGQIIYVTDESGGAVPAFSDGTDWRRFTDRAVVS